MISKTYLILLKPLDWFFFGGEHTYGDGENENYFSRSNKLPQQTALLGMIRYQLLKQAGLLQHQPGKREEGEIRQMEELIGEKSFDMEEAVQGLTRNFGKIKTITPVTIGDVKNNPAEPEFYFKKPLDKGYQIPGFNGGKASYSGVVRPMIFCREEEKIFNHKEYRNYLYWQNSREDELREDEIWEEHTRIGITKRKGKETDKKNFYKQILFQLKEGFRFAFYVTFEWKDDEECRFKPDIIYLGGQRSAFQMDVFEKEEYAAEIKAWYPKEEKEPLVETENRIERIILQSECYVDDLEALTRLVHFHWSFPVAFRHLKTTVSRTNYATLPAKSEHTYYLLQRGSVLYVSTDQKDKLLRMLDNKALRKIGYNLYSTQ